MSFNPIAQQAVSAFLNGNSKRLLIGGEWVEAASGKSFESRNPANFELLSIIAEGDKEDIARAVTAARCAFEGPWSKAKPFERQRILLRLCDLVDRHFEELALLESLDMGAPISKVLAGRQRVIGMMRFFAGLATAIHGETIENSLSGEIVSYTVKEPVGVVGAIIPWNAPISSAVLKLAPALATGCTMVLKPAEQASLVPLRLAELALEAGVPHGVLNVVTGFGESAGAALSRHPDVDKVAFTGSHITGQKIVAASAGNLKRVSLELGGKSPNIVFADADLEAAVPIAAMACFANSGQNCCAGSRLFIEAKIYDEFVQRVADFGKRLRVGHGIDPETQIGPLVSEEQLNRVTTYLQLGKNDGAEVVSGGARLSGGDYDSGYFVPPTVFGHVRDDMQIAQEEIFGPVLSAMPFDDFDEVVRRVNTTPFGLGSGVWTRDVSKAHRLSKRIRAGSVWVNCYQTLDPALPFGGYKMSGYGREGGVQNLEEYLHVKTVCIQVA